MYASPPGDITGPLCFLALSFVISIFLVKWLSPTLSPMLYPIYASLTRAKQLDWDTRVASNVHAILVCVLLSIIFATEEDIYRDPFWGQSILSRCTCGIVVGYLLADVVAMLLHWQCVGDVFYLVHHAATIYPYYFVMNYRVMTFFAMYRLWSELSTPFVNKRWVLEILGYRKSSRGYIANGLIMSGTFFLARILTIPYWYWLMYRTRVGESFNYDRDNFFYLVAFYSCLVLDILNIYWMTKIGRGVLKILGNLKEMKRNENGQLKEN